MRTGRGPQAHSWRRRALGAAVSFIVLSVVLSAGATASDTKTKLAAAKARLAQIQDEIAAESARLAALRAEVNEAAARVYEAQAAVLATQEEIARTQARIESAERRYEQIRGRLNARARDAYIKGPASGLEFILGATSMADLTERVEFIEAVTQNDAQLANEVENLRNQLHIDKGNLQEVKARQIEEREALEAEKARLQANFDEQASIVASLQGKEAEVDDLVADLEVQLRKEIRAAAKAARLAAQKAQGGGAIIVNGPGPFYACPVDQPRGYSDSFGLPRPGGRTHQGIDIFAPEGTPIRAPFDGNAVDASNWPLGGYSVTVYGSQGYVYNAHLSRIGQLGSVSKGTIVGYVGNTGNAAGTSPHDHFEWHPGGGGAVNPYVYLNEVCGS